MAFGESISVTRSGAATGSFDELGNPVLAASSSFTVDGVAVAPLTPQEAADLWGPTNRGGYTLYLPFGVVLESTDTVTVRGESGFQVDGDAGLVQWKSPFTGWEAGAVAVVRRAS